jgi:hypothetical protein
MARQAIRHEGDKAEHLFLRLVGDSVKSRDSKRGDALVLVDGNQHYVEIKQCQSGTINQVRAIKFIPLIVYAPNESNTPWLVVPPQEVIRLVLNKSRGQHTEIPFESANLSPNSISNKFRCKDEDLETKVRDAIRDGSKHGDLQAVMNTLHSELIALKERTKSKVDEIFARQT